ncbi:MAG: type II CAAX endopeptidase family protein [Clostridia bacterium]|nr:type II CAAX endopeptidase family protein [Clostridia bacterium]
MQTKNKYKYNFSDSAKVFLYAVIAPQIFGLILAILVALFASIFNLDYELVMSSIFVDMILLFLVQVSFLTIFLVYNKLKNIDWTVATQIKNKINIKQVAILVAIAVACLFFLSPLISLIDYLISLTGYSASNELSVDLTTAGGLLIGVLALAIFPAIMEELIFRGVIFNGLKKFGYKKAIVISALLFALIHMSIQQTVYQIIIGLFLAYALYITGSLLASITMHFVNNFCILLITYYALINGLDTTTTATFSTVSDYTHVIIYTAIGAFVIWKLFGLLKKESDTQRLNQVPKDDKELVSLEIITQEASNDELVKISEIDVQTAQNNENRKSAHILIIASVISILFWLINFVSYI